MVNIRCVLLIKIFVWNSVNHISSLNFHFASNKIGFLYEITTVFVFMNSSLFLQFSSILVQLHNFSGNAAQRSRGMASKGLRATFLSTVTKVEADYRALQTICTLISYDRVLGHVI